MVKCSIIELMADVERAILVDLKVLSDVRKRMDVNHYKIVLFHLLFRWLNKELIITGAIVKNQPDCAI